LRRSRFWATSSGEKMGADPASWSSEPPQF